MKKFVGAFLSLALSVSVLAGCAGTSTNTKGDTPNSQNSAAQSGAANTAVTFAQGSDITSLEPYNALGTVTATIMFQMFNALTKTDSEGNVVGDLAESFQAKDDLTWEFRLKQGVKFQNGEDFNAATVKYSVERALNPELKFKLAADFAIIQEVKVIDDYTVHIITKEPFAGLPLRIFYLAMVPPGYIGEKGNDYFAQHPVGTGPYKLEKWVKDDQVLLTANETYFNGAPKIQQVRFKPIPEGASRIAALEAGEVDLISGIPTSQIERLKKNDQIEVVSWPTTRVVYIGLNTLASPVMQNKTFRQALNYAVDVDSIITNILDDNGQRIATALAPQYFGYSEEVTPYKHDPEKAKQLLKEAGYQNEPLTLAVSPGAYLNGKEVAEAVAGQLRQVGVNVNVIDKEDSLARTELMSGKIDPLYLNGIGGPYASAELITRIGFGTKERYSTFSHPQMDELRIKGSTTIDETQAAQVWKELQENFIEEAPAIFLYQQYGVYAYNKQLKEWKPRLDEMILLDSASIE